MAQKISRREFLKLASGTSLFGLGVLASGCASEQKQSGGEGWMPDQYHGRGDFPAQLKGRVAIAPENAAIVRDDEKCILCGQCIEACEKVMSVHGYYPLPIKDETACIGCGQCTLWCPTGAIAERPAVQEVEAALADDGKYVVVQTAPATKVSLGEEFGLAPGAVVSAQQVAALKALGFDAVFDTCTGADLTIMEEASEALVRLTKKQEELPHFTSCCPGWVKFCEYFYPDLMGDNAFVTKLWEMPVKNLDGDISTTYYDYLKNYQKSTWWSKAISWTIRKLKPKKKEMNIKSGDGQFNPYYLSEKDDRLANGVRGLIFISVDKKTGVIGINVTDQDPIICKTMADSTTSLLQQAIIDYRTNKARVDVEYYTKLEAEALKSYEEARMKYIRYADSNIDPVLESYRAKRNDLENDMQLKYNKYTTLNTQLDGARAKVQERTPAFTLLKGASVPVKPAGPKRMLFVLGMLIMVTFGGIVYIIKDDIKEALFQSE